MLGNCNLRNEEAKRERGDKMPCKKPGRKIRSRGKGRGLGIGKGKGPIGRRKKGRRK